MSMCAVLMCVCVGGLLYIVVGTFVVCIYKCSVGMYINSYTVYEFPSVDASERLAMSSMYMGRGDQTLSSF